jgi:RNA polymerase sigma factor (sigma-70 family)
VLAFLLHRTRDPEQSLDLTTETFAVVLVRAGQFKAQLGPARGWLFGIAKNLLRESSRRQAVADKTRRKLGIQALSFDDAELERVEQLIDLQRTKLPLTRLVGDLPPEQREAVLARIVDERDYCDISVEMGVTEHTVRQRVSRGLAGLTRLKEKQDHA